MTTYLVILMVTVMWVTSRLGVLEIERIFWCMYVYVSVGGVPGVEWLGFRVGFVQL